MELIIISTIFKIFTPATIRNGFLANQRWQNRKERRNRSTNNADMAEKSEHPESVSLLHLSNYSKAELPRK